MAANQATAVASLQTVETAEALYAATYSHGYTSTLAQLGPPPGAGHPSSQYADMIDSLLASGQRGGYQYVYIPGPVENGKINTYTLKAVPSMPCVTGAEYYTLEPSSATMATSATFQAATQADVIARVLGESLGGVTTKCAPAGP